jgi:EmrB/QacA subfamily drug resistance transporter
VKADPDAVRAPCASEPGTARTFRRPSQATLALAAVCLGFFMILLDGSALNVALPAVQRDVQGSLASLQWVVNVYTIPLASVLLTAGNLGDRFGARRVFTWSLSMFTLASLACALSPSITVLVVARGLQGIAAGGLLPTTLAIIARTYPDHVERAKAITVWGATGGLALVLGPIGGGLLTDLLGWRSIFLINVPAGLLAVVLTVRHVRETPPRPAASADIPGQLAGVVSLSALVAGLIEGGATGWASTITLGLLTVAVLGIVAFLVIERLSSHPMVPMAMFRRRAFTASITNGFAFQFGGYGMQFMLAIYLQDHWHISAARTGLLFLPFSSCWMFGTGVLNRRLIHRGPRWLLWTGAGTALAGALLVMGVSDQRTWPLFAVGTALVGLGCGVFAPSLNAAAMMSVDSAYSGLGSGVLNTARQVGMAVGVALLGAFVALPDAVLGMRISMGLVALCFLTVLLLSVRYVPRKEQ